MFEYEDVCIVIQKAIGKKGRYKKLPTKKSRIG